MNSKMLAGAAAIGAVTAVTALLLGSTAAVAQDVRHDSAYGIAAAGLLPIPPTPYVESIDGEHVSDELIGLGDIRGAGGIGVGVLTVDAGGGAAESSVTKLNVKDLLRADLVRTYCDAGRGGLQIIHGTVLGTALPEAPLPGQTIDVSPLLTVTLGEQTRHSDGSLTVTGIEISLLPAAASDPDRPLTGEERQSLPRIGALLGSDLPAGAATVGDVVSKLGATGVRSGALQTITIGSATCVPADRDDDKSGPSDDEPAGTHAPEAPKPEVVKANLPVTG